jgi:hypothetical protein
MTATGIRRSFLAAIGKRSSVAMVAASFVWRNKG